MPLGDGTGPRGQGPRTGRGLGNCPPVKSKRKKPKGRDKGLGRGRGNSFMGYNNVDIQ